MSAGPSPSQTGHASNPRPTDIRIVQLRVQLVWRSRDNSDAAHSLTRRRAPVVPQAGQRDEAAVGERDRNRLLAGRGLLSRSYRPARGTTAPLDRLPKSGLALDPLALWR